MFVTIDIFYFYESHLENMYIGSQIQKQKIINISTEEMPTYFFKVKIVWWERVQRMFSGELQDSNGLCQVIF